MSIKYFRALALGAALTLPALALANTTQSLVPGAQAASVTVKYGDLDLATRAGAETLYQRIVLASHAVCPSYDIADLARYPRELQCRRETVARTVAAVDSPTLAAVHAEHTRQALTPVVAWSQPAARKS